MDATGECLTSLVFRCPEAWASRIKAIHLTHGGILPGLKPAIDMSTPLWYVGAFLVTGIITATLAMEPLIGIGLVVVGVFLWSFSWKVERFFAAHFGLALVALMAVPILRLTQADNSIRVGIAAALVATAVAVAVRVRVAPPGALVGLAIAFFTFGFIATSTVADDNEWLFYGLELLVAGTAIVFASAAAKLKAWPIVAKLLILVTAAEAALAVFEVFQLSAPLWRGGRILTDGTSTWMRNELVSGIPRAQGTFGHPLPLAFMLVLGALTILRTKAFHPAIRFALFVLMGAGVFVSGSRNAVILFVALSVLTLALPALLKRLPIFILIGLGGLAIAAPFLLEQFEQIVTTGSVFHRVGALESVERLFGFRGTLAVLIGDGSAATPRLYSEGLLQNDGLAAVDNQYVLTFAQNGLIGLALLLVMMIVAFRRASGTVRVLILAVAITGMIFDLFTWPVVGFTVWFLIGAAFAKIPEAGPEQLPLADAATSDRTTVPRLVADNAGRGAGSGSRLPVR